MKNETTYKVEIRVTKEEQTLTLNGTVSFSCNEKDYGNGYHMFVEGLDAPAWGDGYDIRYDTEFDPDCMLSYIANLYGIKFSGKDGRFKMTGIQISEAGD